MAQELGLKWLKLNKHRGMEIFTKKFPTKKVKTGTF